MIKTDDGKHRAEPAGAGIAREDARGLHPKPTLNWLLQSDKAGAQDAEISYITDGIGWKADYVALVNKDDSALDLTGWVTLNNQSGATYKDAKLTLMAGDVRRVQPQELDDDGYGTGESTADGASRRRSSRRRASSSITCTRWSGPRPSATTRPSSSRF